MDKASSTSTFICRRRRQRSPRPRKGTMCHRMRAMRSGAGRKRVQAAFMTTLVTSFSSKVRFSARLLWAGRVVVWAARCQVKAVKAASSSCRVQV